MRRFNAAICVATLFLALFTTADFAEARATCPAAIPTDYVSDDVALNACLAGGGTITLAQGSPGYIIESGLFLTVNGTVFEGPGTNPAPQLIAHPNLARALLTIGYNASFGGAPAVSGFTIRNLRFDGNKAMRAALLSQCLQNSNHGFNLKVNGTSFTISHIQSENTTCGTALELVGSQFQVDNSSFSYNGTSSNLADGITLLVCNDGVVENNTLVDNTDVSLIVGRASQPCRVRNNHLYQLSSTGLAGLMVHQFLANGSDSHVGLEMHDNTVFSNLNKLYIGLMVGGHAWSPSLTVLHAGNIHHNDIEGAVVLAAIDGINAGTFVNNTGRNPQGTLPLSGCASGVAYTAGDIGSATIQAGAIPRTYHGGACQP